MILVINVALCSTIHKHGIVFLDDSLQIQRTHLEFEYSQFRTTIVHQLVYEMNQPVDILLYQMKSALGPTVFWAHHHLFQWRRNQSQRRTQLMRDVYEEALAHLIHLLLAYLLIMLLYSDLLFSFTILEKAEYGVK